MIRPFRRRQRRQHHEIHSPPSRGDQTIGGHVPDLAASAPSQDADPRLLDKQFLAMLIAFADADRTREAPPTDPDDVSTAPVDKS